MQIPRWMSSQQLPILLPLLWPDIDDQGRLVIETPEGRTCLNYGEVSLKLTEKDDK